VSCGPTHYAGCACHEARWEARLAASEARVRALEEALRAEAILLAAAAGIQAVAEEAGRTTKASEVYQYLAFRLALLAPPPEAAKRGWE